MMGKNEGVGVGLHEAETVLLYPPEELRPLRKPLKDPYAPVLGPDAVLEALLVEEVRVSSSMAALSLSLFFFFPLWVSFPALSPLFLLVALLAPAAALALLPWTFRFPLAPPAALLKALPRLLPPLVVALTASFSLPPLLLVSLLAPPLAPAALARITAVLGLAPPLALLEPLLRQLLPEEVLSLSTGLRSLSLLLLAGVLLAAALAFPLLPLAQLPLLPALAPAHLQLGVFPLEGESHGGGGSKGDGEKQEKGESSSVRHG